MSAHFRKILWPTDFSSFSLRAVPLAQKFRDLFDAALTVMHVLPRDRVEPDFPVTADKLMRPAELVENANTQLRALVQGQFPGITNAETHVAIGSPADEICDFARTAGIDLIIMPTHGRTGLDRILMGSVAQRVVQQAHCAVLVVRSLNAKAEVRA